MCVFLIEFLIVKFYFIFFFYLNQKQPFLVEPLPSLLSHRFSPCVHVLISQNLVKKEPRCAKKILKAWDEILYNSQNDSPSLNKNTKSENSIPQLQKLIQFRIFFPAAKRDDETLYIQMSRFKFPSPDNTNKPKEFQFSASKYIPSPTRELPSISYLRSKLIPYTFCQPNDFYDLPQTILILTASDDDDSYIIPGVVRNRGRIINYSKEYNKIPKNNIVYQSNPKKLKSVLLTFLDQIIKPRFRDAFNRVETEFTKTIVMNHLLDDAIQHNTLLSLAASQQIKRYADYQMMKGEHKVAYSLYHQLILHFPAEKSFVPQIESQGLIGSFFSFASQPEEEKKIIPTAFCSSEIPSRIESLSSALLCAACSDIIIGEVTTDTVKSLHFLIENSICIQHRLFTSLLIFWILPRLGQPSPSVLVDFLDSVSESDAQMQSQQTQQSQTHSMIKSSSFASIPPSTSVRASFSLNNLAAAIYKQISSDDFSQQSDEKSAFKLTFPIIVEPYLHEQIIQFYTVRQLPFEYFMLANRFEMTGQTENYVRCLWNSFFTLMRSEGGLQYHNCEFCLSFLIEKIVNVLIRQKNFSNQPKSDSSWFLSDYIGYLMRFDNLQRLPVFASYFSLWDSRQKFYKAGFIRASVLSFDSQNPQISPPRKFRGSWRILSTKLFGVRSSSQAGSFFFVPSESSGVCDTVSPGDVIRVKVSITNKAAHFSVGETWMRIRGCAECEHVNVGSEKKNVCTYSVKPGIRGGLIHLEGLNLIWVNNVCLFTLFQSSLCFRCIEKAPSLVIEELSCSNEVFAGEASVLRLVLHVGPVPLSSLSLLIEADDQFVSAKTGRRQISSPPNFTVLSPQSRCIGGQFFFGKVDANSDVLVNVMHVSTSVGHHSHWLFFAFDAAGVSSRYACYNYVVDVIQHPDKESVRAAMFPSFFGLYEEQRIETSIKPISESRSFQLSLTNAGKKDVSCVCVEFLERKMSDGVNCNCFDDESKCQRFTCNFMSDFSIYFNNKDDVVDDCNDHESESQHEFTSSFDRFIIYGFTKKIFESIGARKSVAFCFGFESLDHETYPYLRITVGNKSYISDTSAIMHFYDMSAIEKNCMNI